MRDWNIIQLRLNTFFRLGLYLTYEGLKLQCFWSWVVKIKPCLYLIYEGLKLVRKSSNRYQEFRLYLTYEGLKPEVLLKTECLPWLFVSYLWGIETKNMRKNLLKQYYVCILPMRDWNCVKSSIYENSSLFVSYLWGIETSISAGVTTSYKNSLYLTYEGLKL